MDKTVKIRPYTDDAKSAALQGSSNGDQNNSPDLARKNAMLEEKTLDQLRIIEQLKESLKQEQVKTAEFAKRTAGLDANVLAVKEAQLEEEKSRSLENLKTIVQLRASLKQEQENSIEIAKRMADQDAKVRSLAELEANELAKKNAQIEEARNKSLEHLKTIEQLKASLAQEQEKIAGMAGNAAELEAKSTALALAEAKVRELTDALGKISSIAAVVKAGQ